MSAPTLSRPAQQAVARPGIAPEQAEQRRNLSTVRQADVLALLGAAVAAVSFASLLFTRLTPFSGLLGFVAVSYALFVAIYALLVWVEEPGTYVRDRLAAVAAHTLGFVMLLALVVVVGFTFWRARDALGNASFFTDDLSDAGPLEPLTVGGMQHALVGTLEQISIALLITVPLGITAAVFLSQFPGRFSRVVRTITEAMTALPSVIAGLFVYSALIIGIELGPVSIKVPRSGLAAALAISVMMLPIIVRASDVVLRLVPGTLIEASLALGASRWRTVWTVVLPTARSGLTTAVILGTARGIGETSPVLLTAGYSTVINANPFKDPQVSLPLATFTLVKQPQETMIARGFGMAATLMALVLLLFIGARILGGRGPGQLSRRQVSRRRAASARDAARFAGYAGAGRIPRSSGYVPVDDMPTQEFRMDLDADGGRTGRDSE
ncbi:PstA family ABC transporter permease [Motilibacter aurantiacus]|uniref:PstA family ABC transporter permease n=1 Tax=Motilibacter aurantiacus TaxID=2714955 RepID=UPI0014086AED|nr:PstA family ABC transporter permease [Motilibacter aurantiacus]NHC47226.1 phosphate ABC transporter permease PstA [Motilibacter aurantiacus]